MNIQILLIIGLIILIIILYYKSKSKSEYFSSYPSFNIPSMGFSGTLTYDNSSKTITLNYTYTPNSTNPVTSVYLNYSGAGINLGNNLYSGSPKKSVIPINPQYNIYSLTINGVLYASIDITNPTATPTPTPSVITQRTSNIDYSISYLNQIITPNNGLIKFNQFNYNNLVMCGLDTSSNLWISTDISSNIPYWYQLTIQTDINYNYIPLVSTFSLNGTQLIYITADLHIYWTSNILDFIPSWIGPLNYPQSTPVLTHLALSNNNICGVAYNYVLMCSTNTDISNNPTNFISSVNPQIFSPNAIFGIGTITLNIFITVSIYLNEAYAIIGSRTNVIGPPYNLIYTANVFVPAPSWVSITIPQNIQLSQVSYYQNNLFILDNSGSLWGANQNITFIDQVPANQNPPNWKQINTNKYININTYNNLIYAIDISNNLCRIDFIQPPSTLRQSRTSSQITTIPNKNFTMWNDLVLQDNMHNNFKQLCVQNNTNNTIIYIDTTNINYTTITDNDITSLVWVSIPNTLNLTYIYNYINQAYGIDNNHNLYYTSNIFVNNPTWIKITVPTTGGGLTQICFNQNGICAIDNGNNTNNKNMYYATTNINPTSQTDATANSPNWTLLKSNIVYVSLYGNEACCLSLQYTILYTPNIFRQTPTWGIIILPVNIPLSRVNYYNNTLIIIGSNTSTNNTIYYTTDLIINNPSTNPSTNKKIFNHNPSWNKISKPDMSYSNVGTLTYKTYFDAYIFINNIYVLSYDSMNYALSIVSQPPPTASITINPSSIIPSNVAQNISIIPTFTFGSPTGTVSIYDTSNSTPLFTSTSIDDSTKPIPVTIPANINVQNKIYNIVVSNNDTPPQSISFQATLLITTPTTGSPIPTTGSPIPTTGSPIPTAGSPIPTAGSPISTAGSPIPTLGFPTGSSTTGFGSSTKGSSSPIAGSGSPTAGSGSPTAGSGSNTIIGLDPIIFYIGLCIILLIIGGVFFMLKKKQSIKSTSETSEIKSTSETSEINSTL